MIFRPPLKEQEALIFRQVKTVWSQATPYNENHYLIQRQKSWGGFPYGEFSKGFVVVLRLPPRLIRPRRVQSGDPGAAAGDRGDKGKQGIFPAVQSLGKGMETGARWECSRQSSSASGWGSSASISSRALSPSSSVSTSRSLRLMARVRVPTN